MIRHVRKPLIRACRLIPGVNRDDAPLVKSPFYVDDGIRVKIAPSAYLHRNVYLADNPLAEAAITIGEGVMIGANVHIMTVKHEVDWRRKQDANGRAWAAPVTVEECCYVGNQAVVL